MFIYPCAKALVRDVLVCLAYCQIQLAIRYPFACIHHRDIGVAVTFGRITTDIKMDVIASALAVGYGAAAALIIHKIIVRNLFSAHANGGSAVAINAYPVLAQHALHMVLQSHWPQTNERIHVWHQMAVQPGLAFYLP